MLSFKNVFVIIITLSVFPFLPPNPPMNTLGLLLPFKCMVFFFNCCYTRARTHTYVCMYVGMYIMKNVQNLYSCMIDIFNSQVTNSTLNTELLRGLLMSFKSLSLTGCWSEINPECQVSLVPTASLHKQTCDFKSRSSVHAVVTKLSSHKGCKVPTSVSTAVGKKGHTLIFFKEDGVSARNMYIPSLPTAMLAFPKR